MHVHKLKITSIYWLNIHCQKRCQLIERCGAHFCANITQNALHSETANWIMIQEMCQFWRYICINNTCSMMSVYESLENFLCFFGILFYFIIWKVLSFSKLRSNQSSFGSAAYSSIGTLKQWTSVKKTNIGFIWPVSLRFNIQI